MLSVPKSFGAKATASKKEISFEMNDTTRTNMQKQFGWLVGCFGFNGPFRQSFSLYRAVSQREGEREEKR